MKRSCLVLALLSGLLLSSCADFWPPPPPVQTQEVVVSPPTEASVLLSCLAEQQKLSRKEYRAAYKAASGDAAKGTDAATLRLICLSAHEYANYKQFKSGMATLANYIKDHPEAARAGLEGVSVLMLRIEKEMAAKWALSSKLEEKEGGEAEKKEVTERPGTPQKEGVEAENKELLERNEVLEKGAVQDQERIKELQRQIEQLKNIEHIIKNRER